MGRIPFVLFHLDLSPRLFPYEITWVSPTFLVASLIQNQNRENLHKYPSSGTPFARLGEIGSCDLIQLVLQVRMAFHRGGKKTTIEEGWS